MYSSTVKPEDLEFEKLRAKVPDLQRHELRVGPDVITRLPCERPWMSPYGAGLIMVTDIRRNADGEIEFQLADENKVPYDNGNAWAKAKAFYREWPD